MQRRRDRYAGEVEEGIKERRLHMIRSLVALIAICVATIVLPPAELAEAALARQEAPEDAALTHARATAARMGATAAAIRGDLASGSFVRIASRMADLAGVEPAVITQGMPDREQLDDINPTLQAPIADILAAAQAAAEQMASAAASEDEAEALTRRADLLSREILEDLRTLQPMPERRARTLAAEVQRSPMLRAAAGGGLTIARALDRALPLLREAAAGLPASSATNVAACDTLDRRPLLCVSGTGANTNDVEALLVIDLGGDDLWTSTAGGANEARCPADVADDPSCRTSVAVDLGGNDTYTPDLDRVVAADHLVAAGSGLGGVGLLVDVAGNDTYAIDVAAREASLDLSYVFGSGNMGLGLLADLGGSDRYELTAAPADVRQPYAHGSALTGMGGLVDLDGENVYRAVIEGPQPPPGPDLAELAANEFLNAQAVGLFGSGLLYDRTGRAQLVTEISATAGPQELTTIVNPVAQGVAIAGGAALVTGTGPTTYRMAATRVASHTGEGVVAERLPGGAFSTGLGVGAIGTAILDDAGGDDTYRTLATSTHRLTAALDPACACAEANLIPDAESAVAGAGVSTQGVAAGVFAPDAGTLVADHAGNDTYTARALQIFEATASAEVEDGRAVATVYPYRWPLVNATGQALGSNAPAVVLDDAGDDAYTLEAISRSTATASAPDARSDAISGQTETNGQASTMFTQAEGALLDLGGTDTYAAASISRAETSPNPDGAWDGTRRITAQGGTGGVFADLDAAASDAFTMTPEPGTVAGFRGEGPGWVDVSATVPGYGIAPGQPAKAETQLTLEVPSDPVPAVWVPFEATLGGPGGPIGGAEVTFQIEYLYSGSLVGMVVPSWNEHRLGHHAVTDEHGVARGWVDVGDFVVWAGGGEFDPSAWTLRVAARFHGDETHRAVTSESPITIDPSS